MGVVAVVQVFFTCTRCAPRCTRLSFFAEGSLHVVSPSTARPLPSLRARRADAPTPGPTPLSVAHAGSRAAFSPPVRLGHLGRTVDVVSGVHVRPGQRCSETPPGGTAPGESPWLQTASALRALKSQRAVLPPMARTGFGPLKVRVLPGPCRLAVLRQVTSPLLQKLPGSTSPGFKNLGVLLLSGWTSGASRQWTRLNCSSSEVTSALLPVVHASTATPSALPFQTVSNKPIPPHCTTVSGHQSTRLNPTDKENKEKQKRGREGRKTSTPEEAETRWLTSQGARVEHFKRLKDEQPSTDPSRRIGAMLTTRACLESWKSVTADSSPQLPCGVEYFSTC